MPNRRQEAEKCSSSFGNLQRTQWAAAAVVVSGRRKEDAGMGKEMAPFSIGGGGRPRGGGARGGAQTFSPPFFWSEAAAAKLFDGIKLSHAKLNIKFIPPLGAMSDSLFGVPSLPPCMDDRTRRRPRIFKPRMAQGTRQTVRRSPLYVVGVAGGANWLSENFSPSAALHSNPVFTAIRSRGPQTFSSQLPPARRFSAQEASPRLRRHRTTPLPPVP